MAEVYRLPTEIPCVLCEEGMGYEPSASSVQLMHRACALREVIGGIGHLVAHEYWCAQKHDPDAGLTFRQSALLAEAWVRVMGVDAAASRA